MKKINVLDLEITVLEDREEQLVVDKIRNDASKKSAEISSIIFETNKGYIRASDAYINAQKLEPAFQNMHPQNILDLLETYENMLRTLLTQDNYYDYAFLLGKNNISARETQDIFLQNLKANLSEEDLKEMQLIAIDRYKQAEEDLKQAKELYTKEIKGDEILNAYNSRIRTYASSIQRKIGYVKGHLRKDMLENVDVEEIEALFEKSIQETREVLSSETFLSTIEALEAVRNLANTYNHFAMIGNLDYVKQGMAYKTEAETQQSKIEPLLYFNLKSKIDPSAN